VYFLCNSAKTNQILRARLAPITPANISRAPLPSIYNLGFTLSDKSLGNVRMSCERIYSNRSRQLSDITANRDLQEKPPIRRLRALVFYQ